jgi:hypothetical protein
MNIHRKTHSGQVPSCSATGSRPGEWIGIACKLLVQYGDPSCSATGSRPGEWIGIACKLLVQYGGSCSATGSRPGEWIRIACKLLVQYGDGYPNGSEQITSSSYRESR